MLFAKEYSVLTVNMKNEIKENMKTQTVTLNQDVKTLANQFVAGQTFRVLGNQGTLVRLSRVGDNAKLTTLPEFVGINLPQTPGTFKPVSKSLDSGRYDEPHQDASGTSHPIVIASCLAGKDSGSIVMHFTPAEEKEYNSGMAKLAEMYPG